MKTCCLVQLANLGLEDSLTWLSFLKLGSWICRKGRRRSPFVKLITVIRQFPLLTHYLFIFQYLKCKKMFVRLFLLLSVLFRRRSKRDRERWLAVHLLNDICILCYDLCVN